LLFSFSILLLSKEFIFKLNYQTTTTRFTQWLHHKHVRLDQGRGLQVTRPHRPGVRGQHRASHRPGAFARGAEARPARRAGPLAAQVGRRRRQVAGRARAHTQPAHPRVLLRLLAQEQPLPAQHRDRLRRGLSTFLS